jgi:hypothetical protein
VDAHKADQISDSFDGYFSLLEQTATAANPQRAGHVRAALVAAKKIENRLQLLVASLLSEVNHERYWAEWGFRSFEDFVDTECEFSLRKAQELIRVYSKLVVELGIAPERIAHLGWSKVALCAARLTPANLEQMLLDINEKSYSQLRESYKKRGKTAKTSGGERHLNVTPIINAAIKKAADATGSGDPQLNLEFVARGFLTSALEFGAISRPGLN